MYMVDKEDKYKVVDNLKNVYGNESIEDIKNSMRNFAQRMSADGSKRYESKGKEIGKLVDLKQISYGDSVSQASKLMKVFLSKYKNDNGTYTIPESLLDHILLQVRIIDKQNRIFNNPDGDLLDESPYRDISGYGMLGENMDNESNNQ